MVKIDDIWNTLTTISDEAIAAAVGKCEELGFDQLRGEVSLQESMLNLKNMRAILVDAIESKKLIQLPLSIQNSIYAEIQAISKSLAALTGGVDEVVNIGVSVERLFTLIWQSRLQDLSGFTAVYKDTENRLKDLELEAERIVKQIKESLELHNELESLVSQISNTAGDIKSLFVEVKQNAADSTKIKTDIEAAGTAAANANSSIEAEKNKATSLLTAISATKAKVDIHDSEIAKYKESVTELNAKAGALVSKLNDEMTKTYQLRDDMVKNLGQVHQRAESLLPGATSAGLAHAFRQRKEAIAKTKKYWLGYFVASIFCLVGFIVWIVVEYPREGASSDWWQHLFQRVPLTFPFVWAGWFFGRNFGHMVRLEEVYAYKESVSQSFEGYKVQMSEVSADKGLPSLCEQAINILSASPLVIFDRKTSDETPIHSWWDKFFSRKKQMTPS